MRYCGLVGTHISSILFPLEYYRLNWGPDGYLLYTEDLSFAHIKFVVQSITCASKYGLHSSANSLVFWVAPPAWLFYNNVTCISIFNKVNTL